jgi:hypothetical protein
VKLKKGDKRQLELPLPVPETRSAFHPLVQPNAFHCRDARQQSRSFARWNQSLRHSPNFKPALLRLSAMIDLPEY